MSCEEKFDFDKLEANVVFCINDFSNCIKTVENRRVNDSLKQVQVQRLKFHEFAEDSIAISYAISSYARDLKAFAECFNDLTTEDILYEMDDLLQTAKKNAVSCNEAEKILK